jgi:HrpA-like RNA helicase
MKAALSPLAQRRLARVQQLSTIEYPADLPVVARREELAQAIEKHQVIIVCGETGSAGPIAGCLSLGRGVLGVIGHTQPRRVAARSVGARIAHELKSELGGLVGYKVRFNDKVSPDTCIKLMTDGILLAEIHHDPILRNYDTIIIDEAHERSLNIDFLLGYLKRLLPRRPDLKLIITSATLDAERFAKHFSDAPVLQVTGRTYPVECCRTEKRRRAGCSWRSGAGRAIRGGLKAMLVFTARRSEYAILPRPCASTSQKSNIAVVLASVHRRAGQGVQTRLGHAPRGAGDQRGGDFADRAQHRLRDRQRSRAH